MKKSSAARDEILVGLGLAGAAAWLAWMAFGKKWKPLTAPTTLVAGTPLAISVPNATPAESTFLASMSALFNNPVMTQPGTPAPSGYPNDGLGTTAARLTGTTKAGGPIVPVGPALFWAKT